MKRKRIKSAVLMIFIFVGLLICLFPFMAQKYKIHQAVRIYNEFMEGKRSCGGDYIQDLVTPTREPERRYATNYIIVDSTGDGVPELHVWGHMYMVYTMKDNDMVFLDSFCSSSAGRYYLLENGVIVYNGYIKSGGGNDYYYFTLDDFGNHISSLSFGWEDINNDYEFDKEDIYHFDGSSCTMEEWFEKTKGYIEVDENGRELVCNEADWMRYCEAQ